MGTFKQILNICTAIMNNQDDHPPLLETTPIDPRIYLLFDPMAASHSLKVITLLLDAFGLNSYENQYLVLVSLIQIHAPHILCRRPINLNATPFKIAVDLLYKDLISNFPRFNHINYLTPQAVSELGTRDFIDYINYR